MDERSIGTKKYKNKTINKKCYKHKVVYIKWRDRKTNEHIETKRILMLWYDENGEHLNMDSNKQQFTTQKCRKYLIFQLIEDHKLKWTAPQEIGLSN